MSRKFYNDLAARYSALKPTGKSATADAALLLWEDMVGQTASAITAQGSTFDRNRFYAACGLTTVH